MNKLFLVAVSTFLITSLQAQQNPETPKKKETITEVRKVLQEEFQKE